MKLLRETLAEAQEKGGAVGHFNISDLVALKAIFEAAWELNVPVLIGTSEGERDFLGPRQAAALVRALREEHQFPIFLNADHTHSMEKAKEAVAAGYDAILFDGAKLNWEENVTQTKFVVEYVKSVNPDILVEGEIGYIGSSSELLKEIPAGAAVRPEDLTTPEQAAEFVKRTGVDLLAPAVGNFHGLLGEASGPDAAGKNLDIARIAAIKKAVNVPLVLHGGSGTSDADFREAINAGVSIIHINTELRLAWRKGMELGLRRKPDEVAPYKLYSFPLEAIKKTVSERLRLFSSPQ